MRKLFKYNKNYKWLLIVQDLFSRKLKALIALKTKRSAEVGDALTDLFKIEKPHSFLSDQGKEFFCRKVYDKFNINWYTTNDITQKVAITERALLVVKQRLFKMMAKEKTLKWIDKLPAILQAYNASFNRTLGMTPSQAEKGVNQSKVFYNTVTKRSKPAGFKFDVGQIVRILRHKHLGSKSYTGNYSNILYEIYKREKRAGAPVYFLKELLTGDEIKGSFYFEELRPVEIDKNNLPKVEGIYGIRLDNDKEQVNIKLAGASRRKWMDYDDLIRDPNY